MCTNDSFGEGYIMEKDLKRQRAIELLQNKSRELNYSRLPKKEDFNSDDVCFIKQKLRPWPRALEAALLKSGPETDKRERNRLKRERLRKKYKEDKKSEDKI